MPDPTKMTEAEYIESQRQNFENRAVTPRTIRQNFESQIAYHKARYKEINSPEWKAMTKKLNA